MGVTKIEGSATILLTRGKYRPGYDISFECKWKGYIDKTIENEEEEKKNDETEKDTKKKIKKASGILKMAEITSEDDCDDWEYHASIKKKSKLNKDGFNLVKNDRDSVIKAINIFIDEFKKKKTL